MNTFVPPWCKHRCVLSRGVQCISYHASLSNPGYLFPKPIDKIYVGVSQMLRIKYLPKSSLFPWYYFCWLSSFPIRLYLWVFYFRNGSQGTETGTPCILILSCSLCTASDLQFSFLFYGLTSNLWINSSIDLRAHSTRQRSFLRSVSSHHLNLSLLSKLMLLKLCKGTTWGADSNTVSWVPPSRSQVGSWTTFLTSSTSDSEVHTWSNTLYKPQRKFGSFQGAWPCSLLTLITPLFPFCTNSLGLCHFVFICNHFPFVWKVTLSGYPAFLLEL